MNNKSFTLIELLVVIVIIGILAGVIIVSTSSSIGKANFAKAQAFSNTVQQELLLNLVSEWTFDNVNNIGEDTWGNNNGIIYGSPVLATKEECVYGTCLTFDGVDDNIDCGNKADYDFANVNHSLSFWVNANEDTSHTQYLLNRRVSGTPGSGYVVYIYTNNYMHFEERATGSATSATSNFSQLFDSWHFIFATTDFNSKTKRLYIDGKKVGENTYTGDLIDSDMSLYLGGISYFGLLDDVRIYKGVVSSSEIKQEYLVGLNSLLSQGSILEKEHNDRLSNLAQR